MRASAIEEGAHDLAAVIDAKRLVTGSQHVDRGEGSRRIPEEPMYDHQIGIDEAAHDLTAVIDAQREGVHGAGHVESGEAPVQIPQEPIRDSGDFGKAHDLTAAID